MNLNEWSKEIHAVAVAHGWWGKEPSFEEVVALCHSELSEALEEHREQKPMVYCPAIEVNASCMGGNCDGENCLKSFPGRKPEGIAVEMADCLIRILDWCGKEGIDIEAIVALKNEYNKTRPYRHACP